MEYVFPSALDMASDRKPRPQGQVEHISEDARIDILNRMAKHEPRISSADLARACNVTPSAITLLLSKPIPKGKTRGCKLWPKLAKAVGIVTDSWSSVSITPKDEALRRAHKVLAEISESQLENWLQNGEFLAATKR